jgi:hypothetical protein
MFRPNWPSSSVYYVRLVLGCNVVFTASASVSVCVLFICDVGCVMLELLVYAYYRLMYIYDTVCMYKG